jgi:hypothetical protein
MALGTLNAAIVTLRVMSFLRKQVPALNVISTDFSSEGANFNQDVIARVVTAPAVAEYDAANGGYNSTGTTVVDIPVKMDKHKHVTIEFNVNELSSTNRNLIDEQAKAAAYSLSKDLVDAVIGKMTKANFPTETVETIANTQRSTLGKLRKDLSTQGASPYGRNAILCGDAFEALTDDTKITSSDFNSKNEEANNATGVLHGIKGFDSVVEYIDLPAANNLTGFAGTRDSLVVSTRLPKDPALVMPELAGGGKVEVITEGDAGGMAMLVRTWYDWKAGKVFFSLVWMYGAAVGVPGQGRRLVSAAT